MQGSLPAAQPPASRDGSLPGNGSLALVLNQTMDGLDKSAYGSVSVAEAEGRVLLAGAVVRPDYRRRLEQTVLGLPGVVAVTDAVLVVDGAQLGQYLPDGAKERDISQRFPLSGVALRVVKGVVFLVGRASAPDAVQALKDGLADDASVKWVDASAVAYRD